MSPDDLLIFKSREEVQGEKQKKAEEKQAKKKKKEAKPQPVAPEPEPEPVTVPKQPQMPPQPRQMQPPIVKPAPVVEKEEAPAPIPETLVSTDLELEAKLGYEEAPKAPVGNTQVPARKVSIHEMKKIAEHMGCELHPWRKAYAICDYCKRPFCYEDIIEHGGVYYCLDDIDKVPQSVKQQQTFRYNSLGVVSATFYMFVFLIFMYYSYSNLIALFNAFSTQGLSAFFQTLLQSQELLMAEAVLALLSLVGGIMIMLQTERSFKIGAAIGLVTVGLFSYQFLNSYMLSYAIVASVSSAGLIMLAYSRVAYESLPTSEVDKAMVSAKSGVMGVAKDSF